MMQLGTIVATTLIIGATMIECYASVTAEHTERPGPIVCGTLNAAQVECQHFAYLGSSTGVARRQVMMLGDAQNEVVSGQRITYLGAGRRLPWWPAQCDVAKGCVWWCVVRDIENRSFIASESRPPAFHVHKLPLTDFESSAEGDFKRLKEPLAHWEREIVDQEFGEAHPWPPGPQFGRGYRQGPSLTPLIEAAPIVANHRGNQDLYRILLHHMPFDIVPVEPHRVRLYFITPEGGPLRLIDRATQTTLHEWEYEFRAYFDEWRGYWKERRSMVANFTAPFQAVHNGDQVFLVTVEGPLYALPKEVDAGDATLRSLPIRGGEIVQLLIYDEDRDRKPFAFTSKYWFEVKEPIEYHEFELGPLKADDPMPTLVRCAREVRKHFPALPKPIAPAIVDPAN